MIAIHCNDTYRIGTDLLPDGRVKAKARGRKTNTQTFPAGTDPEVAAFKLAVKITRPTEDPVSHVVEVSTNGFDKKDFAIYVTAVAE